MSPVLAIVIAFHHVALERQETTIGHCPHIQVCIRFGCCNPTFFFICGRCTGLGLGAGWKCGKTGGRAILLSMTANGCGSSQARADLLGGQPKKVLSHTVPSIFSILMDAVSFEPMSTPALLWPMAACCSQGYLCVVSKLQDMLLHNCHCCAQGQQGRHTDTHNKYFCVLISHIITNQCKLVWCILQSLCMSSMHVYTTSIVPLLISPKV